MFFWPGAPLEASGAPLGAVPTAAFVAGLGHCSKIAFFGFRPFFSIFEPGRPLGGPWEAWEAPGKPLGGPWEAPGRRVWEEG